MIYTARNSKVDATELAVVDAGVGNGDHYFFVRGTGGDALIEKGAFLSMYEAVEPEVQSDVAEFTAPMKRAVKKAVKKVAKTKPVSAKKPVPRETPSAPAAALAGDRPLTLNEAICQVMENHEALTTLELGAEVAKIRPSSELASVYAAVTNCINKGLIQRRESDKKLVAA
jgi:hypothetical protein